MHKLKDPVEIAGAINEIGYFAAAMASLSVGFAQLRPADPGSWGLLASAIGWGAILALDAWTWRITYLNLAEHARAHGVPPDAAFGWTATMWSASTVACAVVSVGFLASTHALAFHGFLVALVLYCITIVVFWHLAKNARSTAASHLIAILERSWNKSFDALHRQTIRDYPGFAIAFVGIAILDACGFEPLARWVLAIALGLGAWLYYRAVLTDPSPAKPTGRS